MHDTTMPSPSATNEAQVARPPEKHLADALRETFRNLDLKDLTPDAIIKRFNKSGGIDRVRIAVERRMKKFTDAQKQHTLAASEEFLNEAVPEGSAMPPAQQLMQRAQDVVLASVKDRIGRDVDSVTEKGTASWFFECVRDEIINVCKEEETTTKTEAEPVAPSKIVDAKAILKNLTRNVVRARHTDHGHDSARLNPNKEQHTNGHTDTATHGKHNLVEMNQPRTKANQSRSDTMPVVEKKEQSMEGCADRDQKENNVPLRSSVENVPDPSLHKSAQQDHPSSGDTMPTSSTNQPSIPQSKTKTKTKKDAQPSQNEKDDNEYDALAEEILGGSSDNLEIEQRVSRSFEIPVSPSKPAVEYNSNRKPEPQVETATATEKVVLPKKPEDAARLLPRREINKEETQAEQLDQEMTSEAEDKKPQKKTSPPGSPELSKMDVEKLQMAAEGSTTRGHGISGHEMIHKDAVMSEDTSKERQSKAEASREPNNGTEKMEIAARKGISEKGSKLEGDDKRKEEGDSVTQKNETKLNEEPKGTAEEATDSASRVRKAEEKPEEKEKPHTPSREEVQSTEEPQPEAEEKNILSHVATHAKESLETDKAERDQGLVPDKEELANTGRRTDVVKATKEVAKPTRYVTKPTKEGAETTKEVSKRAVEAARPAEEVAKATKECATMEVAKPAEKVAKATKEVAKPREEVVKPADEEAAPEKEVAKPTKEGAKLRMDRKANRSDNDHRHRSEIDAAQTLTRRATSPTRRVSRRLSRTTPEDEPVASESKEIGSQEAAIAKKGKRPRGRPKRKIDGNVDVETEGKRRTFKRDVTKNWEEQNERKRRRTQTTDDRVSLPTQPFADRPHPAVENWPRGYGIVKSCVPEDFDTQQKVLHALEILLEKKCATPFSEPVDPSEKGLEMYTSIIKNPMDLGEIWKRLKNSSAERGYYLHVSEVLQDIELVWWNCREYNGQFDPIIGDCDESQHEFSFLLESHGIEVGKGSQKRRRVSRGLAASEQKSEEDAELGDNDGRLVGKTILIFTELEKLKKEKRKKEWFSVEVKAYDAKSNSYTLRWIEKGKTTRKATFGLNKMYPVYRA